MVGDGKSVANAVEYEAKDRSLSVLSIGKGISIKQAWAGILFEPCVRKT